MVSVLCKTFQCQFFSGFTDSIIFARHPDLPFSSAAFTVKEDTCLVLQIFAHTSASPYGSVPCHDFFQLLEPMPDFKYLRREHVYVHPPTPCSDYRIIDETDYLLNPRKIFNLTLSYFYGNILSIEQNPSFPLSYELKYLKNTSWLFLSIDVVYVPTLLSILALEMPVRMDAIEMVPPSYVFPWKMTSYSYDSWLTAEIYYFNCSERNPRHIGALSAFLHDIPLEKICETTISKMLPMQPFQVMFPPNIIFKRNMNEQILEIKFKGTQKISGFKIGNLLVQSVASDVFCIGFYKQCFSKYNQRTCVKFGDLCSSASATHLCSDRKIRKKYLTCQAVHKIDSLIYTDHLNRDESYKIQLLTYRWPNVVFKFNPQYQNELNNMNNKILVTYNWTGSRNNPSDQSKNERNKLYFMKTHQTWFMSFRFCLSKNMTLPSFSSVYNLQDTLLFLNKHYSVPLSGMFVAFAKKVNDLCQKNS